MCGIAGFIDFRQSSDQETLQALAQNMAEMLHHRGPDQQAAWADPHHGIALGHARLSIRDLSPSGAQPIHSPSGRYSMVYNGEIYNDRHIRDHLKLSHGFHAWKGHGDTETLITALDFLGIEGTIADIHGMFAIAVWDHETKELSLIRDRAGEKPLYYGYVGNYFVFASELSSLKVIPGWEGLLDRRAMATFFQYQHIPAPYSIYQNIQKLEPATWLRLSAHKKKAKTQRFWKYPTIQNHTHPATVNELHTILVKAVKHQMQSDVPLGVLLSGGIDSSLIASIMQQSSTHPIHSFTIGFADSPSYDESSHAKKIARHLGTHHIETILTSQDALDVIPKLPTIYDEPFADASQIPTYLVSHAAKQHVTVALSGDGGDEMLGGYRRYIWSDRIQTIHRFVPRFLRWMVANQLTDVSLLHKILLNATVKRIIPQWEDKAEKFGRLLSCNGTDFYPVFTRYWENEPSLIEGAEPYDIPLLKKEKYSLSEWMMIQDFHSYLPNDVLTKVDRASMAVSLETRAPFLDVDVMEVCSRLPLDLKIHKRTTKWATREMLKKYLPEHLFDRPKMGFAVPLSDWLQGPLKPWAEDLLYNDRLFEECMLKKEPIMQCWREFIDNNKRNQQELWSVLMMLSWIDCAKSR